METKDYVYLGIIAILATSLGVVSYNVYETGVKVPCNTNKPYGWNILVDHGTYKEAVCPTKIPKYENCSSFVSTPAYERYYCNQVVLEVNKEEPKELPVDKKDIKSYPCYPEPRGCEIQ